MAWAFLLPAVLLLELAIATTTTTTSGSVCSSAPYIGLQILATHTPALQFCSSKYPLPTPVCTAHSTIINVIIATTTVSKVVSTQTIVQTTGSPSLTTTIIQLPGPTVTEVDTIASTQTVTVSTASQYVKRAATSDSAQCSSSFSALTKSAVNFISTACSCIETTPACKSTTTIVGTSSSTATSIVTVFLTASTTNQVPNTEIDVVSSSTILPAQTDTIITTVVATASVVATTTISTSTTSSTSASATPSARGVPCSNYYVCNGGCVCDLDVDGVNNYCVDDTLPLLIPCSDDAECPATAICDLILGGICNSGPSCTSTYVPGKLKREEVSQMMGWQGSRLNRMQKRGNRFFTLGNGTVVHFPVSKPAA